MLSVNLYSPRDVCLAIARRVRARRLDHNLTQRGLADRSGVSLGSLKRFERTGQVSLESLVRLALVLEATDELETWFSEPEFRSIDDALRRGTRRKRGRRS